LKLRRHFQINHFVTGGKLSMKKIAKLTFGLFVIAGALFLGANHSASINAAVTPDSFIACPTHLIAPYGGSGGWSSVNVQANFAKALVTPQRVMVCQYRFGAGAPFFGIEMPCPAGKHCVAAPKGFHVTP
jgi:hypothetical protein